MRNESLRTKVYTLLRQDIVSGKIPGGTRVTEIAIADSLKVSRTPVREALQKLSQERLLISIPKAGYMVEDLSDDDIQDLFATRMEIEQIAVKKAVQYITVDELKALDDNLEQTKAAIKSGQELELTQLDVAFHSIIYTAARSRSLFRVCKNLGDLTLKYRHGLNMSLSLRNQMLHSHIQIYQAMILKDSQAAGLAVDDHGKKARSLLVNVMKKIRSDSFKLEQY
jgi:DNA-binding GntR family transcriptional regulator